MLPIFYFILIFIHFRGVQFPIWPLSGAASSAKITFVLGGKKEEKKAFIFNLTEIWSLFFKSLRRENVSRRRTNRLLQNSFIFISQIRQKPTWGGGFLCYLRWQYKCLCSSSSWPYKQRQRWQRGGVASRTTRGPCTSLWCRGRRCSWHDTDWRTPPPLRCSCKSSPSQTWGQRQKSSFRNVIKL